MDYPSTSLYLATLLNSTNVAFQNHDLIEELLSSLKLDGYNVVLQPETMFLRGLSQEAKSQNDIILNLVIAAVCVLMAGFASGLTQGLLSLDYMEMKIKAQSGTPKEKENAAKVLPIISNHHLLLVSLMLWNATATEALPLFLDKVVPEYIAIIISVTLVLMFGEIIPASILTGPSQLQIAANLTPMVYLVLTAFFPIAYPISKLLDWIIGHDSGMTMYNKKEIVTMMRLQHEEAIRLASHGGNIRDTMHHEEVTIIGGALSFREMAVEQVMTPVSDAYMISINENLSYKTLYDIFKAGYSRIPVYDKDINDVVGIILAKDLIFVDPDDETPIKNFVELFGRKPIFVWHDQKLGEVLATFRKERAHIALVRDVENMGEGDPFYRVVGIITLEDIIEEILGTEIEDETDSITHDQPVRDIDLVRLKSLRSKAGNDKLSEDEVEAIVYQLKKFVPQVNEMIERDSIDLQELIRRAGVMIMKRKAKQGEPHQADDILIRRGKLTNNCILILQGKVKVLSGANEEVSIKGPWDTIAADVLVQPEGTYIPDFSAFVESEDLRFVRISTFHSIRSPAIRRRRIEQFHLRALSHDARQYVPPSIRNSVRGLQFDEDYHVTLSLNDSKSLLMAAKDDHNEKANHHNDTNNKKFRSKSEVRPSFNGMALSYESNSMFSDSEAAGSFEPGSSLGNSSYMNRTNFQSTSSASSIRNPLLPSSVSSDIPINLSNRIKNDNTLPTEKNNSEKSDKSDSV